VATKGPSIETEVDGRRLSLSNLDKVLYPETGFTKGEVIDYYARIAPVMLPHLEGRCITFRRYPNGVDAKDFFEKRCPSHRPEWVPVARGPGDRNGKVDYCRLEEPASLVWAANLAALELHVPMARAADLDTPTMVVFDLDPGAPAAMRECCEVALHVRDTLAGLDLECLPKTSGSKGLQLYLPLNPRTDAEKTTHEHASSFALAVAQVLEKHLPSLVLTVMKRDLRTGKIFVDWSQNSHHKTTIGVYSLRARPHPTVSTPVTWDEVEAASDGAPLSFEAHEVLDRVAAHGDLFAPTLTLTQTLPAPAG
jgi:bifunctional non-homologous end joining protein LigD